LNDYINESIGGMGVLNKIDKEVKCNDETFGITSTGGM